MSSKVQKFIFNGFQENTFIVHDGNVCVIIDPGCIEPHEEQEILNFIENNGLIPKALLLTHAHIDHVLGCNFILKNFDIPFYLHDGDLSTLHSVQDYSHVYGFPGYTAPRDPDINLNDGDQLTFGEFTFDVMFTPGHAPGHVVFHCKNDGYVINGDVLFAGSFGRVDLPGGDLPTLKRSIIEKMFTLPEETVVYCGHGPETTIKQEKSTNYILQF